MWFCFAVSFCFVRFLRCLECSDVLKLKREYVASVARVQKGGLKRVMMFDLQTLLG